MWVIIRWVKRYSYPILALALFLFSFNLVLQYQIYQHSWYFNNSVAFFRNIDQTKSSITAYFYLRTQNQYLHKENKALRAALKSSEQAQILKFDSTFIDSTTNGLQKSTYQFIQAEVVRNTTNKLDNYFIINRGKNQGIETGMAVISPTGIAGIVVTISDNYSRVMSVLNSHFEITPYQPDLNLRQGVVKWNGGNAQLGELYEINRTEPIKKGQILLSSNYSSIFPPGIPIARIKSVKKTDQKEYQEVKIKFETDFYRLQYVYCIKNKARKEIDALENQTLNND
jgi:rod shape-determining protein MreC